MKIFKCCQSVSCYVRGAWVAVLLVMVCSNVYAQQNAVKQGTRSITGQVLDYITHQRMPKVKVELLRPDSSVVSSVLTGGMTQNGDRITYLSGWHFNVEGAGTYLLRFSFDGYQTQYYKFNAKFGRREYYVSAPDILMKRLDVRMLGEVTVTATKVKFYHKGDTIVYNADAFQLSEGSMLDALIRQMPGAELKSDGKIYVNGRFVESLLLNGKDFFKGNNQVMLDNLPTYMVSNVKVYDKMGKMSEFTKQDMGDKKLVMDVQLKKQYSIGWIGNMELGAGTHDRYLARLFATRFTDHSHIALYGTVNNLNDTRKPGQDDTWKPSDLKGGLMSTKMGGIDYQIDSRMQKWDVSGNVEVKHTDTDYLSTVHRENFLSGGSTFDRMMNATRNYNTEVSTSHDITYNGKQLMVEVTPSLNYSHYDNRSSYRSATFGKDIAGLDRMSLDSIFTPEMGSKLRALAINRNIQQSKTKGHTLQSDIIAFGIYNIPHSSDNVTVLSDVSYMNDAYDLYDRNRVDYFTKKGSTTDFRNQYTSAHPKKGWEYTGKVSYRYLISKGLSISPYYKFSYNNYQGRDLSLYRLDKLGGWGSDTKHELGMLPSEAELLSTFDAKNSYDATQHDTKHSAGVFFWMNKNSDKNFYFMEVDVSLNFLNRKMHYMRAAIDTTFHRRSTLFNSTNTFLQVQSHDKKRTFFTTYYVDTETPDLTYLVRTRDDSNPLQILVGNANLKNTYKHQWSMSYNISNPTKQTTVFAKAELNVTTNALAMGYTYDKTTGIRTIMPDNVNGNWNGNVRLYYNTPLDKKKLLFFTADTKEMLYHHVDLVGVAGSTGSQRSVVNTSMLYQGLKLAYSLGGGSSVGMKASGWWTHATSRRDDFETINAGDFNYGITAVLNLPMKWQFSIDLTMFSKRGYDDSAMNTNDLVWNARVSKSLLHGRILLMVDGFDLLGNLSNVTRTLTAQARVEQFTNVLPRYVMAHVVYRINVKPKKK